MNKRSIYAVSNYVRDAQLLLPTEENNYYNIPEGIINICILFFGSIYEIDDEFTSDGIKIEDNILTVANMNYNYIYFKDIMSSAKYEWTFKMVKIATHEGNHDFFFGIKNDKEQKLPTDLWSEAGTPSLYLMGVYNFGYDETTSLPWITADDLPTNEAEIWQHTSKYITIDSKAKYGKYLKENDIVTMCVDMDKLELKFIINDVDYGVAATFEREEYRAVIMMFEEDDCVELL